MTPRIFVLLLAVAGLTLATLALWNWCHPDEPQVDEAKRQSKQDLGATIAGEPATAAGTGSRMPSASPSSHLRVIVQRAGSPVAANLSWASDPDWTRLDRLLTSCALGAVGDAATGSVHANNCAGEMLITLPHDAWTVLFARETGATARTRWFRIAPFEGGKTQRVEFGERNTVHIQAWRSDLCGPLPDAPLDVTVTDLAGGPLGGARKVRTDSIGQAVLHDVPASAVTISFPAANPELRWPHAVRLILDPNAAPGDLRCVVVEPRPMRTITVRPLLTGCEGLSSAKLYLRRVERDAGIYPQSSVLADGVPDRILVPDGRYVFGLLPGGLAVVAPATLTVTADQELNVRIEADRRARDIELIGIPPAAFPLHLVAQEDENPFDGDPTLLFVGPFGWGSSRGRIAVPGEGVRLAALAHQRTFLASSPIGPSDTGRVDMREATLLQIDWIDGPLLAGRDVVLEIAGRGATVQRQLAPTLLQADATYRPGYSTRVVLPRGTLESTALAADGTVLWTRTIEANAPQQVVRIEN